MSTRILAWLLCPALAVAATTGPTPRLADGHPDLTGNWEGVTGSTSALARPRGPAPAGSINAAMMSPELAAVALKQMSETGAGKAAAALRGTQPLPQFRTPELARRAEELWQHGSDTDPVVACGQPGLPRVGAPLKIVQTARELVFLYADWSGMAWRVVPTDGRGFRERLDPSFYGDAVGHWEGDSLVVETRNLSEETWFGEYGYFHSDKLRVIERFTRHGDELTWQVTVEDPEVLAQPWEKRPVDMRRTGQQLEEPYRCVVTPTSGGHHEQRVP
ncbi:MAG: hypothetical protein U1F30_05285 [Steroidobacteraceae bacterium]